MHNKTVGRPKAGSIIFSGRKKPCINLMLIGCGPHARRVYLPKLSRLQQKHTIKLSAVVDIQAQKNEVAQAVNRSFGGVSPHLLFTHPFTSPVLLPKTLEISLDKLVEEHAIDAVIISTTPLAHLQYALWAAKRRLHVLMDKPISTRRNSSLSPSQASMLYKDFERLCAAVDPDKAFIINAERRYHPGFQYAFGLVEEVAQKYGIPITSMQSSFGDGLWRLPQEILTQDYRSYKVGHGIISHSGYHILDVAAQAILRSFRASGKQFDSIGVFGSFIRPSGLLQQQYKEDYIRALGPEYVKAALLTDKQLASKYASEKLGEVDVSALTTLFNNGEPTATISMQLQHNGFSRRAWAAPNYDLYKGNGRVQHEFHNITQGPYQTIYIHSYQENDTHDVNSVDDYNLGGNNHFDIHVFRNSGIIGGAPLTIVRAQDLAAANNFADGQLLSDQIKGLSLEEFLRIVQGELPAKASKSHLATHALGVQFMSMLYLAGIHRKEVKREPHLASP